MSNFSPPDTKLARLYNPSRLTMKNNGNLQFLNEYSFSPPGVSCLLYLGDSRRKFGVSFMLKPAENYILYGINDHKMHRTEYPLVLQSKLKPV